MEKSDLSPLEYCAGDLGWAELRPQDIAGS